MSASSLNSLRSSSSPGAACRVRQTPGLGLRLPSPAVEKSPQPAALSSKSFLTSKVRRRRRRGRGQGWDPYSTVLLPNQPLVWIDQKLRRPTDVHSIASDVVRRIRQQLTASLSPSTSPSLPLHPHSDCFSLRIFSYLLSPLFGPHSPPRHAICSLLFFFLPSILILHSFPSSLPSSSTPPLSVLLLFLFLLLLLHIIISGRWATPVVCRQRAGRERMSKASCLVLRHSALVSLWHWLSIKH